MKRTKSTDAKMDLWGTPDSTGFGDDLKGPPSA